jgi:plastocyanin
MNRLISRWLAAAIVVGIVALGSAAFGAPMTRSASTPSQPRGIVIDNDAYYPATLRVMPGQSIAVTNQEGEDHSLTARDGSFNTGVYSTGTRYIDAPVTPGRYPYSCLVHGPTVMKGVLIVTG